MHVKVSGTISRVSQIWSKVSGTWTRNKAALIKTNPVTIFGNSYPWAVSYFLKIVGGTSPSTVNGQYNYGVSYGVLPDGSRYYCAPGSYILRTTVTLGSHPSWTAWYTTGGQTYCTFDGQAISFPYSGHSNYAGSTTHTITTGVISSSSAPPAPGANITFMTDTFGTTSTIIEVETAAWKVG
jgi:hypothetical protein